MVVYGFSFIYWNYYRKFYWQLIITIFKACGVHYLKKIPTPDIQQILVLCVCEFERFSSKIVHFTWFTQNIGGKS